MSLLPYACFIVDSVERVGNFLIDLLGCQDFQREALEKPVHHRIILLPGGSSITIVQRSSCDEATLAAFNSYAVKFMFVAVEDVQKVRIAAAKLGAQITRDDVADRVSICFLDGVDEIIIHALDAEKSMGSPHDMIMSAMSSQVQGKSLEDVAVAGVEVVDKVKKINRNPRPVIPTMSVSVLSNNSKSYVPCHPNSREAVPFETEIFKGFALLICRTDPEDPHYKNFFTGKRVFELQVQGQFKRLPIGEIVVGGESTNKMELGLIMRSVCKAVCNFGSTIINDLHFSFGDVQTLLDYQLPHMAAPLFTTMDRVIVTPEKGILPKIGEPFLEDPEYRKKRMKFKNIDDANIQLTNVYSFSVASSNIDFCKWRTVGIPMVRSMDLRTIWGDSDLRLVAYEIPKEIKEKYPNKHPQEMVNYLLNIKLHGLDPDKPVEIALDATDEYEEDDKEDAMQSAEATPLEHTPRSHDLTIETPSDIEVAHFPTDGVYYSSPPRDSSNMQGRKVEKSARGAKLYRTSSDDDAEDDDEGDGDMDGDGDGDGDDKNSSVVNDEEEEDDDDGDEGFGLDTVTEAMMLAKMQQKQNRAKVARKVSMLSLLLPTEGEGGRDGGDVGPGSPSGGNFSRNVGSWFRRRVGKGEDTRVGEVRESEGYYRTDYAMESEGDMRYCPACIEVNDRRRDGRRRVVYVMPWGNDADGLQPRLRSYTEISSAIPMQPLRKTHKTKRLSIEEKKRLQIIESHRSALLTGGGFDTTTDGSISPVRESSNTLQGSLPTTSSTTSATTSFTLHLKALLGDANDTDTNFLGGFVSVRKVKGKVGPERWEGSVAMATSGRHWTEQSMQITKTEVLLRKNHDAIRVSLRIPIKNIIRVRPMLKDGLPFPGFSYFYIETFSRLHYFLVRSDRQLQEWIKAFDCLDSSGTQEQDFYLARPPCWRLEKKRLFNCRRILFSSSATSSALPHELMAYLNRPVALAESLLKKVLKLATVMSEQMLGSFSVEETSLWIDFLDQLSVLQVLNISVLPDKERAVFLLNIYHVMVIHGSLVMGPPPAWSSWPSFFNDISYLLCFDIVGIAEMEHNLLRAGMSRPSSSLSKVPCPQTLYPEMALTQRDFRFNFCINPGSLSMLPYVPLYSVSTFDAQLDEMTSRFLEDSVEIDLTRRVVTLPKYCHWYPSDFSSRRYGSTNTPTPYTAQNAGHGVNGTMTSSSGMNNTGNTANTAAPMNGPPPTPIDCLKVLVHYLRREEKEKVLHLLFESSPPAVKYKKFTYRCRTLISEKDYFKKAAPSWNHTGHDGSHGSHGTSSEEKEPVSI